MFWVLLLTFCRSGKTLYDLFCLSLSKASPYRSLHVEIFSFFRHENKKSWWHVYFFVFFIHNPANINRFLFSKLCAEADAELVYDALRSKCWAMNGFFSIGYWSCEDLDHYVMSSSRILSHYSLGLFISRRSSFNSSWSCCIWSSSCCWVAKCC